MDSDHSFNRNKKRKINLIDNSNSDNSIQNVMKLINNDKIHHKIYEKLTRRNSADFSQNTSSNPDNNTKFNDNPKPFIFSSNKFTSNRFNSNINDKNNSNSNININTNSEFIEINKRLDKIELLLKNSFKITNSNIEDNFNKLAVDIEFIKKKLSKEKIYKEIENTNKKIQNVEDSIFQLTKELNDLQVHALHGNFELHKNTIDDLEEENQINHIYN
jgi:HPt (histidine-containing phosphotransfer) domain-containing protein